MRQKLFDHVKKKYKVKPEYPWRKYPDYAVLRHSDNNKWFALVAEVERTRLGLPGDEYGIYAIRGPRGIPNSLSAALNN